MKNKLLVLTLFFTIIFCQKNAFCQLLTLQWERCFGGSNEDYPECILLSPTDNSAVIVGTTKSTNHDLYDPNINGETDIWAVKINNDGNKVWQQKYGTNLKDSAGDAVCEPKDDQITVLNTIIGPYYPNTLNPCGNYLPPYSYEFTYLYAKTFSNTPPPDNTNTFCLPTTFSSHSGYTKKIRKMPNGNYAIVCTRAGNEFPSYPQIGCFDNQGQIIWQEQYGFSTGDNVKDLVVDEYNQLYSIYLKNDIPGNTYKIRKHDATGNLIWAKTLTNIDDIGIYTYVALKKLSNGNLLVGTTLQGTLNYPTAYKGKKDIWLAEIDSANGNIVKERCLGSTNDELIRSMDIAPNGDIIIGATTNSLTANNGDVKEAGSEQDIWVLRVHPSNFSILLQKRLNTGMGMVENNCLVVGINNTDIIGTYGTNLSLPSPLVSHPLGGKDFWVFKLTTKTTILCPAQGQTQNPDIYIKKIQWDNLQQYPSNSRAETGYGNYKNVTFNLVKGNTYPLTLVPNLNVENTWSIAVDINNDSKFNNLDQYIKKTGVGTIIHNLTIPTTAPTGCYTMRVIMKQGNTYPTTLCGTIQDAEVEDYTICIQNPKTDLNDNTQNYLYPNPTHSSFNYNWNTTQAQKYIFKIMDIHGKTLQNTEVQAQQGYNTTQFFTQNLPQGLYLLQIIDQNNQATTQKFIKQ